MSADPVAAIQNWGKQTVVFALGLRTDSDWLALSDEEQAKRVHAEYGPICEKLWNQSQTECPDNPIRMAKVFSRNVLQWVQETVPLTD